MSDLPPWEQTPMAETDLERLDSLRRRGISARKRIRDARSRLFASPSRLGRIPQHAAKLPSHRAQRLKRLLTPSRVPCVGSWLPQSYRQKASLQVSKAASIRSRKIDGVSSSVSYRRRSCGGRCGDLLLLADFHKNHRCYCRDLRLTDDATAAADCVGQGVDAGVWGKDQPSRFLGQTATPLITLICRTAEQLRACVGTPSGLFR